MLEKILSEAVSLDASDIHLTVGQPPFFRVAGEMQCEMRNAHFRTRNGKLFGRNFIAAT